MDSTNTQAPIGEATSQGPSPFSAGQALGDVRAAAVEMGRARRLDNADGSWRCWGCDGEYPFHPSLHCEPCRTKAIARTSAEQRAERRLDEEQWRWRGMTQNMASDTRLDRDAAVRMLEAARKLSSATPERVRALSGAFDKRFEEAIRPRRGFTTYEYSANGEGDWVR